MCTDLLGLCSCHSNNAADALSDGLLRDYDKRRGVTRVLQMTTDKRNKRQITNTVYSQDGSGDGEQ